MPEDFRDQLSKEITRKQFMQYLAVAALSIFGVGNVISLLTGSKKHHTTIVIGGNAKDRHGFGSSKFGA